MRSILTFLAVMLSDLSRLMREIFARLIERPAFAPVLEIMGKVRAQVEKVASIFDKAPCSATGGSA